MIATGDFTFTSIVNKILQINQQNIDRLIQKWQQRIKKRQHVNQPPIKATKQQQQLIDYCYLQYKIDQGDSLMQNNKPKVFIITLLISMVISGSINTLDSKFQNQQYVQQGDYAKYFYHPYMQTYIIYIATTLAFPIFILRKKMYPQVYALKLEEAKSSGKIIEYKKHIVLFCTISNIIANTFQNISLNFIPGSVYQMTRGGAIATTLFFSIFYLKNKAKRHQLVGSCLAILGVIIVGISNVIYAKSSKSNDSSYQYLGYLLLIISLFLNGFSLTFQENLLRKYHLEPIELTGYEGIYGITIYTGILIALTFIPCSFGSNACVYFDNNPYMERPDVYIKELGDHYPLLFTTLLEVCSLLVFNITGLSITKYINSLSRAICDVTRTVIIWIVGIIITVTVGRSQQNYRWQSTEGGAIAMQLTGFAILVIGNFIYNKIIVFECLPVKQEIDGYKAIDQLGKQT